MINEQSNNHHIIWNAATPAQRTAEIKAELFQIKARRHVEQLIQLVHTIPLHGENCQRCNLMKRTKELKQVITDVTQKYFI